MLGVLPALACGPAGSGRPAELTLLALAMRGGGTHGRHPPARGRRSSWWPRSCRSPGLLVSVISRRCGLTGGPRCSIVVLTLAWVVGVTNASTCSTTWMASPGMAVIAGGFRFALFRLDGDVGAATMTAGSSARSWGSSSRATPPGAHLRGGRGSLFLGFFLSGLCLVVDAAYYSRGITAVLAIPGPAGPHSHLRHHFVIVTRLLRGQPLVPRRRDHTSHRLVTSGAAASGGRWPYSSGPLILGGGAGSPHASGPTIGPPVVAPAGRIHGVLTSRDPPEPGGGRAPAARRPPGQPVVLPVQAPVSAGAAARSAIDCRLSSVACTAPRTSCASRIRSRVNKPMLIRTLAPVLVCQLSGLGALRGVSRIWRYTGRGRLSCASGGASRWGTVAACSTSSFTTRFAGLSRAVFVLDWVFLAVLVGASRCRSGCSASVRSPGPGPGPCLVYGAWAAASRC
mgnify:CR=1 FL=1